jgi:hypothetical protein
MLYFIAVILFLIWIGGVNSHMLYGGFIHVFLVLSVLIVLLKIAGRKQLIVPPKTAHVVNSPNQFNTSNGIALGLLVIGLVSMVLGVNEMNPEGTTFNTSMLMFVAGIIGSSVGFIGLLRTRTRKR